MMKCTDYVGAGSWDEYANHTPCHCPECGGFLSWPKEDTPICNKCGAELMIFPEIDEETGEELDYGKICPISTASEEVKI